MGRRSTATKADTGTMADGLTAGGAAADAAKADGAMADGVMADGVMVHGAMVNGAITGGDGRPCWPITMADGTIVAGCMPWCCVA